MVGEEVEPKICSIDEALKISSNLGLDLVEISPNVDPPCLLYTSPSPRD